MNAPTTTPSRTVAAATVDRIVLCTALLWCRHATLPTARDVASAARVSPSTVTGAYGDLAGLFDAVAARELMKIRRCLETRTPRDALAQHAVALHAFDRSLVRWPALALARATTCGFDLSWLTPPAVAALHAMGALVAMPDATVGDAMAALDRLGWLGARLLRAG